MVIQRPLWAPRPNIWRPLAGQQKPWEFLNANGQLKEIQLLSFGCQLKIQNSRGLILTHFVTRDKM